MTYSTTPIFKDSETLLLINRSGGWVQTTPMGFIRYFSPTDRGFRLLMSALEQTSLDSQITSKIFQKITEKKVQDILKDIKKIRRFTEIPQQTLFEIRIARENDDYLQVITLFITEITEACASFAYSQEKGKKLFKGKFLHLFFESFFQTPEFSKLFKELAKQNSLTTPHLPNAKGS